MFSNLCMQVMKDTSNCNCIAIVSLITKLNLVIQQKKHSVVSLTLVVTDWDSPFCWRHQATIPVYHVVPGTYSTYTLLRVGQIGVRCLHLIQWMVSMRYSLRVSTIRTTGREPSPCHLQCRTFTENTKMPITKPIVDTDLVIIRDHKPSMVSVGR